MKRAVLVVVVVEVLCAVGAWAAEESGARAAGPRLKLAMVTADKYSRDEKSVFSSDSPKIFAVYEVTNAAQGTKLKAVWIADKVEGLEAKTKLTETESTFSSKGEFMGSFSCPKPPKGWSAGTYTVELSVDGAVRKTLTFRVEK